MRKLARSCLSCLSQIFFFPKCPASITWIFYSLLSHGNFRPWPSVCNGVYREWRRQCDMCARAYVLRLVFRSPRIHYRNLPLCRAQNAGFLAFEDSLLLPRPKSWIGKSFSSFRWTWNRFKLFWRSFFDVFAVRVIRQRIYIDSSRERIEIHFTVYAIFVFTEAQRWLIVRVIIIVKRRPSIGKMFPETCARHINHKALRTDSINCLSMEIIVERFINRPWLLPIVSATPLHATHNNGGGYKKKKRKRERAREKRDGRVFAVAKMEKCRSGGGSGGYCFR